LRDLGPTRRLRKVQQCDPDIQDEPELDALAVGGQSLLADIQDEAAAHVDEHYHPWDGQGDEPPEHVSAYLALMGQRVELARFELGRAGTR
jgi:hypothetical protein